MAVFQYVQISDAFIRRLTELVLKRQSVVVLGARHIGKRYLLARLQEALRNTKAEPVAQVRFLEAQLGDPETENYFPSVQIDNGVAELPSDVEGVFHWCDASLLDENGVATLLASNVDSMPFQRARGFLAGVRTRVERKSPFRGHFTAVLTGEFDLRHLVYGPNSEFNSAHQFVVQGFAEDQFELFAATYLTALGLEVDGSEPGFFGELWRRTGGNGYLLRLLFWSAFELWVTQRAARPQRIRLADVPDRMIWSRVPWMCRPGQLRRIDRAIAQSPQCWARLKALRSQEAVAAPLGEPDLLELAGFAVREAGRLRFASPLIEQLIEQHYNDWQFVGFRARQGEWDMAFEEYSRLDARDRIRPRDTDDVEDTEAVIGALCAHLYGSVPRGPLELKQLLVKGAELILGFTEVSFWEYDRLWQPETAPGLRLPSQSPALYREVLPEVDSPSAEIVPSPHRFDHQVLVATFPAVNASQWGAVIVGKPDDVYVLSPERRRLAQTLLEHFLHAYSHAIDVERNRVRLRAREQYSKIVSDIFAFLGSEVTDVSHALARAAQGLRKLGYRRVLFCLVDPTKTRIRGVLDSPDDPRVNIARMTDWPLDKPTADVQPYVISTRQAKIIEDASLDPLASMKVVATAGLRAMAVVPIVNRRNEAIGTIHIEREDRTTPTQDEVEELEAFGRQLAVAIEKSEKENLLQSALAKQPEPIVILDRTGAPVFASGEAASLFGICAGWRGPLPEKDSRENGWLNVARKYALQAMTEKHRFVRPVEKTEPNHPYRRASVLTDFIADWQEETVGAFCHVQELDSFYRVFGAIQVLLYDWKDTDSVIGGALRAAETLGHKWGRLYVVSEEVPEYFVGKACFGLADPGLKDEFEGGKIVLSSRGQSGHEAWVCVDQEEPLVFGCRPDMPDRSRYFTMQGLEVTNVQRSSCPARLEKRPGDLWIDFPLMAGKRVLGKITLECDERYRPEDFTFLRVLFVVTRQLLEASIRWEERMSWIQEASERAVADTSHHIATTLAALPVLLTRYRRVEGKFEGLADLNVDFAHLCDHVTTIIRHTKERLAPVAIQRSRGDIISKLRESLKSTLPEEAWAISGPDALEADFDFRLMQGAFLELVQNSKQCSLAPDNLKVAVTAETLTRDGEERLLLGYYDNGPGVPRNLKEKIFANFFSCRPGRETGTGLGMGYIRRIVEAHGGTVEERGDPGKGVCFVIIFPRYTAIQIPTEKEVQS